MRGGIITQATCKYCGKTRKVNPSDVKNVDDYHCKGCHPTYLKEKKDRGEMIWDWSAIRKLNKIAMNNGHKNIFSNGVRKSE